MRAEVSQGEDSDTASSADERLGHFGQLEWQRRQRYVGENLC